jgi:hypothetical protein
VHVWTQLLFRQFLGSIFVQAFFLREIIIQKLADAGILARVAARS